MLIRLFTITFLGLGPSQAFAKNCTDFSGFWSGTCTYEGQAVDSTFLAWEQNECSSIKDGTLPVVIGSTTTSEWSYDGNTATRTVTLGWVSNLTKLQMDISLRRVNQDGSESTLTGTDTIEIANGQLVIPTSGTLLVKANGQTMTFPYEQVCTYNKVGDIPQGP